MVDQVGALREDRRAIARLTEELAHGSTAAAAELRAAMARVEQRAALVRRPPAAPFPGQAQLRQSA